MTKNAIAAAGLSCILVFGTCACSFSSSSSSSTTVETSTTDDEGTTTTTKTTTTTSDGESETETETSTSLDMSDWTDAWMGTTDQGFGVYYAQSQEGTEAFLVLHNDDVTESFIGPTENPEEDVVTVNGHEATFTFQVLGKGEDLDVIELYFGEDYGTAELERCELDELADAVHEFDPDGAILAV